MDKKLLVQLFNLKFPVGATVRWRSIASDKCPHKEYTVLVPAQVKHGNAITLFAEKSGIVSIEPEFVDYE